MRLTTIEQTQQRPWSRGAVVEYRLRASRGVLVPGAAPASAIAMLERVLENAQLDHATRYQLTRVLTVTVQDWTRK